jgi:hypothetical protein
MNVEKHTEFPEERKAEIVQLESIAWHCNNLLCPFCMEKHASLVTGLSSEIADGNEGDQATHRQLSDEASKVIDRLQKNKQMHGFTEDDVNFYRDWSRAWRRKLSGASADGHNHAEEITKNGEKQKHTMLNDSSPGSEKRSEEELYARCVAEGNSISVCRRQK